MIIKVTKFIKLFLKILYKIIYIILIDYNYIVYILQYIYI
jgi:hypothetical protein